MKFKLTHSLVAIAMIASPLVFADDSKIYSGAHCDRHSGSDEYDRAGGAIRNLSETVDLVVMCPIVKDSVDMRILSASVMMRDRSTEAKVRCKIQSIFLTDTGGINKNLSIVAKTSGSGNIPQTEAIPDGVPDSGVGANHFMRCVIPPVDKGPSSVISYRVDEGSPTILTSPSS